ncbi:hypothetical protein [Butyrivibrio sp. LC3010]|uniref:hypothetical protein n=1 Tax=Butyrivibrio sp. LC3010 TaxID=1280680 RepID=UPI0003F64628|nr:hypothetical protein [Butyrivibrio sp. LC3010]
MMPCAKRQTIRQENHDSRNNAGIGKRIREATYLKSSREDLRGTDRRKEYVLNCLDTEAAIYRYVPEEDIHSCMGVKQLGGDIICKSK